MSVGHTARWGLGGGGLSHRPSALQIPNGPSSLLTPKFISSSVQSCVLVFRPVASLGCAPGTAREAGAPWEASFRERVVTYSASQTRVHSAPPPLPCPFSLSPWPQPCLASSSPTCTVSPALPGCLASTVHPTAGQSCLRSCPARRPSMAAPYPQDKGPALSLAFKAWSFPTYSSSSAS